MHLNWQDIQEQTSYMHHLNFQLVSHLQYESMSCSVKCNPFVILEKKKKKKLCSHTSIRKSFPITKRQKEEGRKRQGRIDKLSESLVEEEEGLQAAGW